MTVQQQQNGTGEASLRQGDFRLGRWQVQPQLNRIVTTDEVCQIEPKIMEVLLCLAEQEGKVVSRDKLMERVWPDTFVAEITLTRCISELRKVFGDDPQNPQAIETIRKKGYRLLLPVRPVAPTVNGHPHEPDTLRLSQTPAASLWSNKLFLPGFMFASLLLILALAWWSSDEQPDFRSAPLKARPLTSLPGKEIDPAPAPDGQQIAFAWSGETEENFDIYLRSVKAEKLLRLTDNPARECRPVWSPDEKRLAFLRYESAGCKILTVSVTGGDEQVVTSCHQMKPPDLAWSPDGNWLAFSDYTATDKPARIWMLSLSTGERRVLTTPAPDNRYGDRDPVFSPDGAMVAFRRVLAEEIQELCLIPFQGGAVRQLTFGQRRISGHSWTPDSRQIIFASERGGSFSLWQIPAAGGTPQWVPVGTEGVVNPSFAGRKTSLAFQQMSVDTNIWRVQLNDAISAVTPAERLIASTRLEGHPQFSPDGQRIALTTNRSGNYEIMVMNSDGSDPVQLTSFGGGFAGLPRWSPDGSTLCFVARLDGNPDIYVVSGTGGGIWRVTSDPADDWAPVWSPDGQWIYFSSTRSGNWQIWKVSVPGGRPQQVTQNGGIIAAVSTDGRHLYYTKGGVPGLWRMQLNSNEETLLFAPPDRVDWGNWLVTDQGFFFVRWNQTGPAIAFFDFTSKQTHEVFRLEKAPLWNTPGLSLAPDRRSLLFTQADRDESDLLMIDDLP